jgi:two-component system response regulator AtoC
MSGATKQAGFNLLVYGKENAFSGLISQPPGPVIGEVHVCPQSEEIFPLIEEKDISIILMDIGSDPEKGLDLLHEVKEFDSLKDVILVGRSLEQDTVMELINAGAKDYLEAPVDVDKLITILEDIHSMKTLRRETFRLERRLEKKYQFYGIIGKSPYMLEIFSLIEKIAKYFTCILLTGETGTGKEKVAQAIHALCQPKNKDMVLCDCASIPDNLFESELFGYKKGAFTGADRDKKGLFEEADQGIIFLDEVGEIPLSTQAKLLRVLEYNQFRPLGSNTVRKVDIRVIAATNQDLRERVKNTTFREDLYHRLNKVEIHLPPLRERREDIPLLVRHFLSRYQKKFQKDLRGVSRQTQKLFLRYRWPGNIRELDNVLERSAMMARKEFIDIPDLPNYLQKEAPSDKVLPFIDRDNLSSLDELEKDYIIHLLKVTNGNLRKTAQILNISRTTLYSKIAKYKLGDR